MTPLEKRISALELDMETYTGEFCSMPDEPTAAITSMPLLSENDKGDINLYFINLYGSVYTYIHDKGNKTMMTGISNKPFGRVRFASPKGKNKYMPIKADVYGSLPYITPALSELFLKKKTFNTLYIVEGEFKAISMQYILGLPCIGVSGIHNLKRKGKDKLFEEIKLLKENCGFMKIVFLLDADCLKVEYGEGKDLYLRPNLFYTAVRNFKNLAAELEIDIRFKHIDRRYENDENGKGIDDLLSAYKGDRKIIKKELTQEGLGEFRYIKSYENLRYVKESKLKALFKIDDVNKFYAFYAEQIGTERFIYARGEYQYDALYNTLDCKRLPEANGYIYIGSQLYFNTVKAKTNRASEYERTLLSTSSIGIKAKYGKSKMEKIIEQIPYYDGVFNSPGHGNKYEQVRRENDPETGNYATYYNTYAKVSWKASEGDCPHSMNFIKHIFGEKLVTIPAHTRRIKGKEVEYAEQVVPYYQLGLDYLQKLWLDPQHMLPILCLVSEERHTGKTTFCDWLREIFQQNVKDIRSDDLNSQFTGYFASSLIATIDETFIEKKSTMETVKKLVTAKKAPLEKKGKDSVEIQNFLKFILCSNNVNNFILVDNDEIRYWVVEVKSIEQDKAIFDLLTKMTAEIPAFLHYLEQREMVTPRKSRQHFAPSLIKTDALKNVIKGTRSSAETEIIDALREHFSQVKKYELGLSTRDIRDLLFDQKRTLRSIKRVLQDKWKIKATPYSMKYKIYTVITDQGGNLVSTSMVKSSIHFMVPIHKVFSAEIIFELLEMSEVLALSQKYEEFDTNKMALHYATEHYGKKGGKVSHIVEKAIQELPPKTDK